MRTFGVVWGVLGVVAVLVYAIVKLSRYMLDAMSSGMSAVEWAAFAASVVFMAFAEGYRGFQLKFSPRVAARALHLYEHPTPVRVALAPFFCVGYFAATPRLMRVTWIGTAMIVGLVYAVHGLPQPWRGILDAGVCAGLTWGTISLVGACWSVFRHPNTQVAAEVPAGAGL